jgi:hypothetical protein
MATICHPLSAIRYLLFPPSARERTSADFLRAGLSAYGPASLTVSLRLLLSVIAFANLAAIILQSRDFVKSSGLKLA